MGLDSPPSPPSRPTPASIESAITGGFLTTPPPKLPLMTSFRVAGRAELGTGGDLIGVNNLPNQLPLSPTKRGGDDDKEKGRSTEGVDAPQRPQVGGTTDAITLGRKNVVQPSTGTRYGRGLTGVGRGTNRQWGGGTPMCPKCGKLVYFAEQVRARERNTDTPDQNTDGGLRRRKPSDKRSIRAACAALNVTLGWTQEG